MTLTMLARRRSLPVQVTGFVGRSRELRALGTLLGEARLVTLVGPGGVGKTRLALRAAEGALDSFPDGVHLVELSALSDPALLPRTVAAVVGLPEQESKRAEEQLADFLAERRVLIVLDTCEHLVEACALLVETLLRQTEAVTVLVTTRQPLDVSGEHTLPVPPLPIDEEAVSLFAQRAASVVPGFTVDDGNRAAVTALCRRLDGIPLAIELATVRLRAIPLDGLLARLEDRFTLLTSRRSAMPRHQTLRTTILWSHDLCLPEERLLWARLSVFAGSFDLAAAEAVCGGEALPAEEVVECLVGLVDKSVVLKTEDEGGRYHLLDTMREFGAEHLEALGESALVRRRHLEHYAGLAGHFHERAFSDEQVELYTALHRERANLRAAMEHGLSLPGREGAALVVGLWPYWLCGGQLAEGCYWLRRVLDSVPEASQERARALGNLGWFLLWHGDHAAAVPYIEQLAEVAADLQDEQLGAWATKLRGSYLTVSGQVAEGLELLREAAGLLEEWNHRAFALMDAAVAQATAGAFEDALATCEQVLDLVGRDSREGYLRGNVLAVAGFCEWFRGEHERAGQTMRAALRMKHALRDQFAIGMIVETLAIQAAHGGRMVRTASLCGVGDAIWQRFAAPLAGTEVMIALRDRAARKARRELGGERYDAAFRHGAGLSLDDAVRLADSDGDTVVARPPRADLELLSVREQEVAGLIAEGMTNRQIAERLVISKRTADAHVEHILAKLGLSSRAEVSALVAAGG